MNKFEIVICTLLCLLSFSCSSLREFKNPVKEENLYGMIIDEKNQPVGDFKIRCRDKNFHTKYAATNSSGLFTVEDLSTGALFISGSKNGYVEIRNQKIDFMGTNKIYCWQINSVEGVLNSVEKNLLAENYEQAVEQFNGLKVYPGSEEEILIKELIEKISMKKSKEEVDEDEELEI